MFLPVKCNFVTKFFLVDNSIQYVVTDVGSCSFHPLNEYFSFSHIKVVLEEWARTWGLPVKFLGNVSPKLCNRKRSPTSLSFSDVFILRCLTSLCTGPSHNFRALYSSTYHQGSFLYLSNLIIHHSPNPPSIPMS